MILLFFSSYVRSSNVEITYTDLKNETEKEIATEIKNSSVNSIFYSLFNNYFSFKDNLTVRYGCFNAVFYDPVDNSINISYDFFKITKLYFSRHSEISPDRGAIDTLLHSLLHEAGHAIISEYNIKVLGKEEDAVDDFATMMLLTYVDNGDAMAINAAKMFYFESSYKPDYYHIGEFAGEHSLDLQRYFSVLCLVYGSNDIKHKDLLNDIDEQNLSKVKNYCKEKYLKVKYNWIDIINNN
ncbi:DUF4344 domain-containing metallopeptidase [Aliivibrio fischeri]|uniref:DUF4344 domain-containing metallopeptidase n=1 Tax=Aliivibrio fischeri TaxID=668 RepID=UPI001668947E|nr:DUF4344 domain-containing metallopeptidase [Aliivibrio fischeri]USR97986.1 DUF4344 domain-containing metallopeptidase [Aliivibrio fischeri ATCC 7744 = JCM 18803 = DSM 507]GGK43601.1 hypothetical protein GCM10007987_28610 [Aliivibrio fischeri]